MKTITYTCDNCEKEISADNRGAPKQLWIVGWGLSYYDGKTTSFNVSNNTSVQWCRECCTEKIGIFDERTAKEKGAEPITEYTTAERLEILLREIAQEEAQEAIDRS